MKIGIKSSPFIILLFWIVIFFPTGAQADSVITGQLTNFVNTLEDSTAGSRSIHFLSFTNENPIPKSGKIHFDFQGGFDLNPIEQVMLSIAGLPDTFEIEDYRIQNQALTLVLSPDLPVIPGNSTLDINVDCLENDTVAGQHVVLAWTTTSRDSLIDGPSISRPYNLVPGSLFDVRIFPDHDTTAFAGRSIYFHAEGYDQYGNIINSLEFLWEIRPDSCGSIENGIFQADKVGLCYIRVSSQGIADTSGAITVRPGILGDIQLLGVPERVIAGHSFPDPVGVLARDIRGNRKTDFLGPVYFSSTCDSAILYYDIHNPYNFAVQDSGLHYFAGVEFVFCSAGLQRLLVWREDESWESSQIIVDHGDINRFTLLDIRDSIGAGRPFDIEVTDVIDRFGNPVTGVIEVRGGIGVNPSPYGFPPELNNIWIDNGAGSASQILYSAEPAQLILYTYNYSDSTDTLGVQPGPLNEMELSISTPQISDEPFIGEAYIEALDGYGNLKTDMNADSNNVSVYAVDGSPMSNNVFTDPGDFIEGYCDLVSHETSYLGPGGRVEFISVSPSIPDTARSSPVDMLSLGMESLKLRDTLLFIRDSVEASLNITNPTDLSIRIDSLVVLTESGQRFLARPYSMLPDTLRGHQSSIYDIVFYIPDGVDPGYNPLRVNAFACCHDTIHFETLMPDYQDTGFVAAHKMIDVDHNSISPDSVVIGHSYSFTISVTDTFNTPIALDNSSSLVIVDNQNTVYSAELIQAYLQPHVPTTLVFRSQRISPEFNHGSYFPSLMLNGVMGEYTYIDSVVVQHPVEVSEISSFSYTANTLDPDSVVTTVPAHFHVRISNIGQVPIELNQDSTFIRFSDGHEVFYSAADTASEYRVDYIWPGGDTAIYFRPETIDDSFNIGRYAPALNLMGLQNGVRVQSDFVLLSDSIEVFSKAQITVDSTYVSCPNAPWLNIGQQFDFVAELRNGGTEGISNIVLKLQSNGVSHFQDSLVIDHLSGMEQVTVNYPVTADSNPSWESFWMVISSAIGEISGQEVEVIIDQPLLVYKQTPAEVGISYFGMPGDTVQPCIVISGRQFTAEALIFKTGQAEISGDMRVEIDLSDAPGFSVADSVYRDFVIGEPVEYMINSAADSGLFSLSIGFPGEIIDVNDTSSALGPDSTARFDVLVVPGAYIEGSLSIVAPEGALDGVLSTNQAFYLKDSISVEGGITSLTATIDLPPGYSTLEPTTKFVYGDTVGWQLTAPNTRDAGIRVILVELEGIDRNSNEPVATTDRVDILTVNEADLYPEMYIIGPASASDFILDPLQEFVVGFRCENLGQAGVYAGKVEVGSADGDFKLVTPGIRDFLISEEITFTIQAPSYQILNPVDIYTKIIEIPADSNSNAPAKINRDSLSLQFLVKNLKPDLIMEGYRGFAGQGIAGTEINALELYFYNRDNGSSYPILISEFELESLDQDGRSIRFEDLASDIRLIDSRGKTAEGVISNEKAHFEDIDDLVIPPGERDTVSFYFKFVDNIKHQGFRLHMPKQGISASALRDNIPVIDIDVRTPSGDSVDVLTAPAGLSSPDLKASFGNYPNPFDPINGSCQFSYYLSRKSDISLKIYTLTGQPVWGREYKGDDEHCLAGNHSGSSTYPPIVWNGRNGNGHVVNNGIYIAVFDVHATGQQARTKVAVVK